MKWGKKTSSVWRPGTTLDQGPCERLRDLYIHGSPSPLPTHMGAPAARSNPFPFFSKKNPISNFLPILSNKKKEKKRGKSPCNSLLQQAACKAETMMRGELSARAKRQPAARPLPARVNLSVFFLKSRRSPETEFRPKFRRISLFPNERGFWIQKRNSGRNFGDFDRNSWFFYRKMMHINRKWCQCSVYMKKLKILAEFLLIMCILTFYNA